jgi:single-strand DNA-binding protein
MLNQVVIVGRLVEDPKVEKGENHDYSFMRLAVPRSYKNADGEYETDFINCKLWDAVATNTAEYCKKGDIIGVKGRVETSVYEKDGDKKYEQSIVAEKVTFLSSKSHDKEEETSKDNDDLDM